jgi:hypothetical protein
MNVTRTTSWISGGHIGADKNSHYEYYPYDIVSMRGIIETEKNSHDECNPYDIMNMSHDEYNF